MKNGEFSRRFDGQERAGQKAGAPLILIPAERECHVADTHERRDTLAFDDAISCYRLKIAERSLTSGAAGHREVLTSLSELTLTATRPDSSDRILDSTDRDDRRATRHLSFRRARRGSGLTLDSATDVISAVIYTPRPAARARCVPNSEINLRASASD